MATATTAPKRILLVHAAEDRDAAQRLRRHLGAPRRKDLLVTTVDDVPPGSSWREAIDQLVDGATLVVALLSVDLLSSDLWYHELSTIQERRPELRLVPVLVRSASLERTMFERAQVLPRSGVSVAAHVLADEIWTEIAREIRGVLAAPSPAPRPAPPQPAPPQPAPPQPALPQVIKQEAGKAPRVGTAGSKREPPAATPPQAQVEPPRPPPEPALPLRLLNAAQQGTLVPFAGAGVSMAVQRKGGDRPLFPSWAGLLEAAAARLAADGHVDDAGSVRGAMRRHKNPSYLEAARIARDSLGPIWFEVLRDALDRPRHEALDASLDLPQALWELGNQLIVTTNYDRVLHWACPDRENLRTWSIEAAAEQIGMIRGGGVAFPTVWHLHGVITDAVNLILTPDGYGRLYGSDDPRAESRYQAARSALRVLLMSRTFLFVGFSFDDKSFAQELAWLEETFQGAAGPHYLCVREAERDRLASRLGKLPIEPIVYADHGAPLLSLLRRLTGPRLP